MDQLRAQLIRGVGASIALAPNPAPVMPRENSAAPVQPSVQFTSSNVEESVLSKFARFTPNNVEGFTRSTATLLPRTAKIFVVWTVLFLALLITLYSFGFAPVGILEIGDTIKSWFTSGQQSSLGVSATHAEPANLETPVVATLPATTEARILISAIGVDAPIIIPASRDLNILNDALLKGAVYYPDSGLLGAIGNVLIFGHSTGLSIVRNQNFEVFNRLQELKEGDIIRIRAEDREYWYRVRSLSIKDARETEVLMSTTESVLTLVTCKIFGGNGKESRYVVEAEFVRSYPLAI
ncbi:MAG: hypothetical protein A3C12_02100 [Candidatus Sungbacteria bacterium RIFCSPHIGHO2_02_FULL_49_20]|uniref:Sortase n=1 Tax=Candidatus Sungbacteria bacterium RIFCSPHIGHO2_02_FULL_49_20 TaxID=1802272 RepID=A0A1G2KSX2_9BACT|nr:MAG: hypothetical protein A3C12_02100 [Candidatus Sungbacteria bacterium RIFCSPHIGHO2_02_FULL_49_20]